MSKLPTSFALSSGGTDIITSQLLRNFVRLNPFLAHPLNSLHELHGIFFLLEPISVHRRSGSWSLVFRQLLPQTLFHRFRLCVLMPSWNILVINQLWRDATLRGTLGLHLANTRSKRNSDPPSLPWLGRTCFLHPPWTLLSPFWIWWTLQLACLNGRAFVIGGHWAILPGNELDNRILRWCCSIFRMINPVVRLESHLSCLRG